MEKILENLEKKLRELFKGENSGHDIYHLKRVSNIALTIQEKEGGDRFVIGIAALLHDVHRIIEKETGKFCPPKESLFMIKEILEPFDISEDKKEMILHCIEFHEEYAFTKEGKTVEDKETLIVQDADNLDAIGAIGIARTFMYSGANGIPMWLPEFPLKEGVYSDENRDPSCLHHFYNKLLRLKKNMNTETGKKMAELRHKVIQDFVNEFVDEWQGKK